MLGKNFYPVLHTLSKLIGFLPTFLSTFNYYRVIAFNIVPNDSHSSVILNQPTPEFVCRVLLKNWPSQCFWYKFYRAIFFRFFFVKQNTLLFIILTCFHMMIKVSQKMCVIEFIFPNCFMIMLRQMAPALSTFHSFWLTALFLQGYCCRPVIPPKWSLRERWTPVSKSRISPTFKCLPQPS